MNEKLGIFMTQLYIFVEEKLFLGFSIKHCKVTKEQVSNGANAYIDYKRKKGSKVFPIKLSSIQAVMA